MSSRTARCQALPPDGGWGWVVVLASFCLHVFADGVIFSFGIYHHELVKYFSASEASTSLIASILVGFTLCVGPAASALVNRFGCRVVAACGGLVGALGIMVSAFANSIATLQVTIGVITGTGLGLIYLPATVTVTSYFRRKRALATGLAVCGSGMGTFLMAPLTQWLVGEFGWRGAMAISGALTLHCSVCGLLFRPLEGSNRRRATSPRNSESKIDPASKLPEVEVRASHSVLGPVICHRGTTVVGSCLNNVQSRGEGGQHHCYEKDVHAAEEDRASAGKPLLHSGRVPTEGAPDHSPEPCTTKIWDFSLFKEPIFLIFALSNFCTSLGFNVPFVYIVSQAEAKGIPKSVGSYLISVIGISNTSGRIILGYFFDKKGVNRQWLYNACLIIGGISTILSTLCSSVMGYVAYAAAFGFTVGAFAGLTSVIVVDILGLEKLSNVFGFLLLFQGIANLLGPPITGWLYDSTNSYTPGFVVAGSVILTSGLILFLLPAVQRHSTCLETEAANSAV